MEGFLERLEGIAGRLSTKISEGEKLLVTNAGTSIHKLQILYQMTLKIW
jgi:hypothetical protein